MAIIVGRKEEQTILKDILDSKKAEFLAIYGRRRVGKTYLIREFFTEKKCSFFQITGIKDGLLKEQLYEFTRSLEAAFYPIGMSLKEPVSWLAALEMLTQSMNSYKTNKKIVLFFDEIPWLASKRSRFLQALDYYWNVKWSSNPNIKLIVCGSAASWIIDNIINNRGGLHNRITSKIRLEPFSLLEVKGYLKFRGITLNNQQILELYMVTGGVPHYLNNVEKGSSAAQNIDKLCFSKNGLLFKEYENLIPSLFDDAEIYQEIIRIIATNFYGIERSKLISLLKIVSGGRINQRLNELEEAGFIASFVPYGNKKRGNYYRVIDEYIMFYLNWIEPQVKSINHQSKARGYWDQQSKSPSYRSWSGYAFEAVCYKHISQIMRLLKIPVISQVGFWRYIPKSPDESNGAQIDLLFDRDDGIVNICEIKYNKEPFIIDKQYAKNLSNKIEVFSSQMKSNKQIFISMITASGLKPTLYSEELVTNVINAADLFE